MTSRTDRTGGEIVVDVRPAGDLADGADETRSSENAGEE